MNKASPTECDASKTAKVTRAIPKRDCTSRKACVTSHQNTTGLTVRNIPDCGDGKLVNIHVRQLHITLGNQNKTLGISIDLTTKVIPLIVKSNHS